MPTEEETPFLHLVKTSHFRAARALLELGADVDFRDPRGMTALHYMLKKRSDERHFRMVLRDGARARGDLAPRRSHGERDHDAQAKCGLSGDGSEARGPLNAVA